MTIKEEYKKELARARRSLGYYKRYGVDLGVEIKPPKRPTRGSIRALKKQYGELKARGEHYERLYKGSKFARPKDEDPEELKQEWIERRGEDLSDIEAEIIINNARLQATAAIQVMRNLWTQVAEEASKNYVDLIIDMAIYNEGKKRTAAGLLRWIESNRIQRLVQAYDSKNVFSAQSTGRRGYAEEIMRLAHELGLSGGDIPPIPF